MWKKVANFFKKSWKIIVGVLAGIFGIVWLLLGRKKQQAVLQNTIESNDRANETEKQFQDRVEDVREKAEKEHATRVEEAKNVEKAEVEKAKEDLRNRTNENQNLDNKALAERFGSTLGVNVVLPGSEDGDA